MDKKGDFPNMFCLTCRILKVGAILMIHSGIDTDKHRRFSSGSRN